MAVQPWWILAACVVLSAILALAGVARAALAALRLKKHVDAILATPFMSHAMEAKSDAERLNATLAQMPPLLARTRIALESISESLAQLRMPKAALALRTASAAFRLLVSGR